MKAQFLNARKLSARLVFEGRLTLRSPTRVGGEDPDTPTDAPVLRDAEGVPYLPGSSLKGLFRDLSDPSRDELLFGDRWGAAKTGRTGGAQARLLVDDAGVVTPHDVVATEIRDGVAIDPELGTAAHRRKYDGEWLPVGTVFAVRLELWLEGHETRDGHRLDGLLRLLRAMEARRLLVGARTSRGFGRTAVVLRGSDGDRESASWRWTLTKYEWTDPDALFAWLGEGVNGLGSEWPKPSRHRFADAKAVAEQLARPEPAEPPEDDVVLAVDFRIDGTVNVRGPGDAPGDATKVSDSAHLSRRTPGCREQPIIPGTSLAGVLRHRCLRIARTLLPASRAVEAWEIVDRIFGPRAQGRTGAHGGARASRIQVPELVVEDGRILRHTRVRIDPWRGGAADALLFTDDALFGGRLQGKLRLRRDPATAGTATEKVEIALLLLALRDVATGDLWLGSDAAGGRGRLKPGQDDGTFLTVENGLTSVVVRYADEQIEVAPHGAERPYYEALENWRAGE